MLTVRVDPTCSVPLRLALAMVGAVGTMRMGPKTGDVTLDGAEMPLSAVAVTRSTLSATVSSGVHEGTVVVATTVKGEAVSSAASHS